MVAQAIKALSRRKTREEILDLSASLFAQHGYDGVSMRDVAAAVGLTQAALYYHFSDKDQLYLDAVAYEFRDREAELKTMLASGGTTWERLERFVRGLARMMAMDKEFLRLMQWVRLDGDEKRQSILASSVFTGIFVAVHDLALELAPHKDPHLLAMSIIGLVIFHFETGATRKFMPRHRDEQEDPEVVASHVYELLRRSLGDAEGGPISRKVD